MNPRIKLNLEPLAQTIEVERGAPLRSVLSAYGVEFPCGGRGSCGACRVRKIAGVLPVTEDQATLLTAEEVAAGWRLACRATAEGDVTLEVGQWETVVLVDHSSFGFTPRSGLGVAVDLGTTTVVAQLLDLASGRVLAVRTALNPQVSYGSDVMTRIQVAMHGDGGEKLTSELRHGVGGLLADLGASTRRDAVQLASVVIAGNTVMHHLFCGIDLAPLSGWPFEPRDPGPRRFHARELGWNLDGDPIVRVLPCLGGFVGGDVLCGVLATRMDRSDAPVVLVDLGTNGEIVIGNRDRMVCASTAAGPAFEGGGIRSGMRATTGAISEVTASGGRLRCRVVGDAAPRGICGSGLVDAVAAGLDLGLIEPSGRLVHGRPLELAPAVTLVQRDIRQLQLAKAAVAAGIRLLRGRFRDRGGEPPPVYLAGAFGNYINPASARRIGLLDCPESAIRPAGNTALLGAKMALCAADTEADEFARIRRRVEHVSLAADPAFDATYVAELAFPA